MSKCQKCPITYILYSNNINNHPQYNLQIIKIPKNHPPINFFFVMLQQHVNTPGSNTTLLNLYKQLYFMVSKIKRQNIKKLIILGTKGIGVGGGE